MARQGKLAQELAQWMLKEIGAMHPQTGRPLVRYDFIKATIIYAAHFAAGYAVGYLAGVTTRWAVDTVLDAVDDA